VSFSLSFWVFNNNMYENYHSQPAWDFLFCSIFRFKKIHKTVTILLSKTQYLSKHDISLNTWKTTTNMTLKKKPTNMTFNMHVIDNLIHNITNFLMCWGICITRCGDACITMVEGWELRRKKRRVRCLIPLFNFYERHTHSPPP